MHAVTKDAIRERKGDSWVCLTFNFLLFIFVYNISYYLISYFNVFVHVSPASSLLTDRALSDQQQLNLSTKHHITYNLYDGIKL